jgi:hypothetical protein
MVTDKEMFSFFQTLAEKNGAVEFINAVNDLYHDITPRPIEKVKAKLESSGKFIVYKSERGTLVVRLNHAYKEVSWREKHWFCYDVIKAVITAIFSIIVGLSLFQLKSHQIDESRQKPVQQKPLK